MPKEEVERTIDQTISLTKGLLGDFSMEFNNIKGFKDTKFNKKQTSIVMKLLQLKDQQIKKRIQKRIDELEKEYKILSVTGKTRSIFLPTIITIITMGSSMLIQTGSSQSPDILFTPQAM